ncbi:MAG: methyltransferase, TIGR04325 family [Solirubrobacteraceae bacterium]
MAVALGETRSQVVHARSDAAAAFQRLEDAGRADLAQVMGALQVVADDEPRQRGALARLRTDPSYEQAYSDEEPLVSIVIPTFDNYQLLCERALPSALTQTYENIEVIVVGDGAPAVVRRAVEEVGDPRVSFHNLSYRGPYPDDPQRRWLVAGVPPFNEGARRAAGRWIAPLDDDDAFFPDHVERLLSHAREQRAELAYGAIREHFPDGSVRSFGCFPPALGQFNLQAAIYHAGLAGVFELELADAEWGEPYDWGLCRRMLRAGVRMSMLDEDEEVVHYYASKNWAPERRQEVEDEHPTPEWELAEEGWGAARAAEQQSGQGWDVTAVARSYARKWPEFREAIDGPGPLGVGHEVPDGVPMRRDDPLAQNTILAFGHVLARAARHKDSISVLDWGGALGHHYEIGRRLFDDLALDYHCRELPAVCEEGRRVAPDVEFHDTDDCLQQAYDLVMASGSLQYEDDWAGLLRRLAEAASPWLFVTRLPVAREHPTFAIRQRAHAYGYETEYVGWAVNRDELVATAREAGLELVREFVLLDPMPVAGAPEDPVHVGLLFRSREPT